MTVSGLANATAAASGIYQGCASTSAGEVKCWGRNLNGQLGNGTSVDSPTPVPVIGLTGATAAFAGGHSSCAIAGGALKCWGLNIYGQLGDGTTMDSSSPVTVSGGLTSIAQVAPGVYHTCAVLSTGATYCWGDNSYGQFGNGGTTSSTTPVPAMGFFGTVAVAVAYQDTCAILANGSVWCSGKNNFGQLGNSTMMDSSAAVQVAPW